MFCASCQKRMSVHYSTGCGVLRYVCMTGKDDVDTQQRCASLSGGVLDALVTSKIMLALEPAALELSLQAADDLQQERQRLDQDWRQRLERARYEAGRAERQHRAAEPENRLVVRQLERHWEEALVQVEKLEQDYARFRQIHPVALSEQEREQIRALAENLPVLWSAATTSAADRQRIVRLLMNRVVVHVQHSSDRVEVELHWSGGFASRHELVRPVAGYQRMAEYDRLIERIEELRRRGLTFAEIAADLNREGFRPAQQAERFHKNIVSRMFRKLRQQRPSACEIAKQELLGQDEWFALSLAARLEMPKNTLLEWVRRGWVRVVRQLPGYRGRRVCWADAAEITRLVRLRDSKRGRREPVLPMELTTPKVPMAKGCENRRGS